MASINKEQFISTLRVVALRVKPSYCSRFLKTFREHLLNKKRLPNIVDAENSGDKSDYDEVLKLILLGTGDRKDLETLSGEALRLFEESKPEVIDHDINLTYDYYNVEEVLRKLLPPKVEVPTSFETIGHVAHLNLRDEHLPYKELIGKVMLDKLQPRIRTVVNKTGSIENEFRVFPMELLAGENNFIAEVRQNDCFFRLDYSKVYWNTRLEQEHIRLVRSFEKNDVICDMFGGIGPFAVPSGKRKLRVFANDLNPESVKWMRENVKRNKVENYIECFNLDGREFVRKLLERCTKEGPGSQSFFTRVVMNLPASAVEFLDVFRGAFDRELWKGRLPMIHCYAFSRSEDPLAELVERAGKAMGLPPKDATVFDVRDVSPHKRMYCLNFRLTEDIAFEEGSNDDVMTDKEATPVEKDKERPLKRSKTEQ